MSSEGQDPARGSEPGEERVRKIRVHKVMKASTSAGDDAAAAKRNLALDKKIAELIPAIADVSLSASAAKSTQAVASEVVQAHTSREAARRKEVQEFATIYDMQRPHPGDYARKPEGWQQKLRPEPRGLELSQYEREMINYQRMFLRRNIWYYRDRASVPRGPCPLHVLKSAWVSGIIDENTLVWGHGLFDWLPAKNVKLLLPMIRTPEVRFGTWVKRTFSLKPALNKIREQRAEVRTADKLTQQVERMR